MEKKKRPVFGECSIEDFEHQHVAKGSQYCVLCAEGPFAPEKVKLITQRVDPYLQTGEGDKLYACLPCYEERYGK